MGRDARLVLVLAGFVLLAACVALVLYSSDDAESLDSDRGQPPPTEDVRDKGARRRRTSVAGTSSPEVDRRGKAEDASDPDQRRAGAARIVGHVGDGEGHDVPGVVIALCRDVSDLPSIGIQGPVVGTTRSDDQGRFELTGMDVGDRYLLRAEHPDFASSFHPGIRLSPGEDKRLDIELSRGLTITGSVRDGDGLALEDVEILVFDSSRKAESPLATIERTTRSDAEGRFKVQNLTPGAKRVTARRAGYATRTVPLVRLERNRPAKPIEFALTKGMTITGSVTDPSGLGIGGAVVSARMTGPEGRRRGGFYYPPVETAADGTFVYDGLEDGRYLLHAVAAGYRGGARASARSGDEGVRIVMKPLPVIRGRVIDAETGAPVTRFRITLARSEYLIFESRQLTQRFDDAEGRFEYRGRALGVFYLFARAPGYGGGRSERIEVADGATEREGVVIQMHRGGTITGRIVAAGGHPIAGAEVDLVPTMSINAAGSQPQVAQLFGEMLTRAERTTKTASDGTYTFPQVAEGYYRVKARHRRYSDETLRDAILVPAAGEIRFPDLTLMRGGTVTGTVMNRGSDDPSPGAKIQLVSQTRVGGTRYAATTDENGHFKINHVRPGLYRINILERGGVPTGFEDIFLGQQREPIMVEDGGSLDVVVK